MQETNPLPWGTQDRYQAHFIVKKNPEHVIDYSARTILSTTGHFGSKKVQNVKWDGGKLADTLNGDLELNRKITTQSVRDATIFVESTDNGIRIYGKWKNKHDFIISKEMFDIFDKIAGHIKKL